MDMRDRVEQGLGGFERAVRHIPGYRGYAERESAREADKLLRDSVVAGLTAETDRLTDAQRRLLDSGGLKYLDEVEGTVRRLQTLANTVRTGAYGYAGLFDAVKVEKAELSALYEQDARLLDAIPTLTAVTDALLAAVGDNERLPSAITAVQSSVAALQSLWNARRDALLRAGSGESLPGTDLTVGQ
ncbi:MAG: hypothetical protein ACYC5O_07715 [Anaerolineae bacterium]